MEYRNYHFKYRYLYPLLVSLCYYVLSVMFIFSLDRYYKLVDLNLFTGLLILFFLLEAIIRFNASQKLKVPKLVFILEVSVYYLFLSLAAGKFFTLQDTGIWIIWTISIIAWLQLADIAALFSVFQVDCKKIFAKSSDNWSLDEFRRLLDYPSTWKTIVKKISFSNIIIVLIWFIIRELDYILIAATFTYILIQLFLLSLAYMDKKTIDWHIEGIECPRIIREKGNKFIIVILLAAVVLAAILPYNYSPLPMDTIANWFKSALTGLSSNKMIQQGNSSTEPMANRNSGQEQLTNGRSSFVLVIFFFLQVLLYGIFILILIMFLLFLLKIEFSNFKNIPDFFKKFFVFFISYFKEIFKRIKKINISNIFSSEKVRKKRFYKKENTREISRIKNINLPTNPRSIIIVVYNSLLKLLSIRGYQRKSDQTPYEYSSMLENIDVKSSDEISSLTNVYVETIYSDHFLKESTINLIKKLWKNLKNTF